MVQAVPEHPKKENVFCLSNSYGDVYLFQVPAAKCPRFRLLVALKFSSLVRNRLPLDVALTCAALQIPRLNPT